VRSRVTWETFHCKFRETESSHTFRCLPLCKHQSRGRCRGCSDSEPNDTLRSSCLRTGGSHGLRVCKGMSWEPTSRAFTYEIPRIRFIFPGSTKFNVLICFTTGHRNWTSPPPKGADPRFLIYPVISIRFGRRVLEERTHSELQTV
jgi:hypothetical protein